MNSFSPSHWDQTVPFHSLSPDLKNNSISRALSHRSLSAVILSILFSHPVIFFFFLLMFQKFSDKWCMRCDSKQLLLIDWVTWLSAPGYRRFLEFIFWAKINHLTGENTIVCLPEVAATKEMKICGQKIILSRCNCY